MKSTKRVFRVFTAWQDNKEEEWLNEMASQGWGLTKYAFYYEFEKIKPTNYIYKLDFKDSSKLDMDEYKIIFQDAGWEHVAQFGGWHYFRTVGDSENIPDIYSDLESKIQKYKALNKSLMLGFLSLLFMTMGFMTDFYSRYSDISKFIVGGFLFIIVFAIWKVSRKIKYLRTQ